MLEEIYLLKKQSTISRGNAVMVHNVSILMGAFIESIVNLNVSRKISIKSALKSH